MKLRICVIIFALLLLPLTTTATEEKFVFKLNETEISLLPLEGNLWKERGKFGITGVVVTCGKYLYLHNFIGQDGKIHRRTGFFIMQKTGRAGVIERQAGLRIWLDESGKPPIAHEYAVPTKGGDRHGGYIILLPKEEYEKIITCTSARRAQGKHI